MNNLENTNQATIFLQAWGIMPFVIIGIAIILLLIFIASLGIISNTASIDKKLSKIDNYLKHIEEKEGKRADS